MNDALNSIWFIIGLFPFLCAAGSHLFYCFCDKRGYADITKMVLMPLLLLAYGTAAFLVGRMPSVFIIAALMSSWLGDLFLLRTDKKSFVLGVLSFGAAHLLYIVFAMLKLAALDGNIQLMVVGILLVLYGAGIALLMLRLFRYLKTMTKPVFCYMLLIACMSMCFVLHAVEQPSIAAIIAAVGSLFFVLSDSTLAHVEFIGIFPKSRFAVMATYLLAQLCITLSAVLSL